MQDADASAGMMEVDEAEPAAPEVPRKLVQSLHNVQVNAKVTSYDYDGLADSRSLLQTFVAIDPRQLILIHGTAKVGVPLLHAHVIIARLLHMLLLVQDQWGCLPYCISLSLHRLNLQQGAVQCILLHASA